MSKGKSLDSWLVSLSSQTHPYWYRDGKGKKERWEESQKELCPRNYGEGELTVSNAAERPRKINVWKCLMATLTRAVSAEPRGRREAHDHTFSRILLWKSKVKRGRNLQMRGYKPEDEILKFITTPKFVLHWGKVKKTIDREKLRIWELIDRDSTQGEKSHKCTNYFSSNEKPKSLLAFKAPTRALLSSPALSPLPSEDLVTWPSCWSSHQLLFALSPDI